jgi:amino acid adenylation domain-containing protein
VQTVNKDYLKEVALAAADRKKEQAYWLNKLAGDLEKNTFPYSDPGPNRNLEEKDQVKQVCFGVDDKIFLRLAEISKNSDFRLHMILAAILALLLDKYDFYRNKEIIIGTPVYRQEVEGELINTILALRIHIKEHMTFRDLLLHVGETVFEANEHQNYPLENLVSELNLPPSAPGGDFPLFDIAVLLENIQEKAYLQHIKLSMIFSFLRQEHGLDGVIEYNCLRYQETAVQGIVTHYLRLLEQALFKVDIPLEQLDILTTGEKKSLLDDFNDTREEYPYRKTLHRLFEEQEERTPNTTALVGPGPRSRANHREMHLTYRQLNQKANRLARLLKRKGAKADRIIGIMMDRSLEMIVGMLAILKSGGAYLPLSPDSPQNQAISRLDDARSPLLLTRQHILDNKSYTGLQSLHKREVEPFVTGRRPQIRDFDGLPIPDRSLVNYEKYHQYIGVAIVKHSISLQASRGCPFNCAYCHKIWPKTHIVRQAENLFAEILVYYHMGVRRFVFLDDVFNLNVKNSSKLLEMIIKNRLKVHLSIILRADILTKEYIDLAVEAGTFRTALSLETASPRLQKMIGKRLNLERFRENLEYICQKHPRVISELNTMIGFPSESEPEALMTLDFVKSIHWVHFPYVHILKIYPNTEMEKLARENGISSEAIARSADLAYHELPETSQLDKNFILKYQSDFLNEYFLRKERLLHVLPHQARVLTEDEMVQKYNSYLPVDIKNFSDLLNFTGIKPAELAAMDFLPEESVAVPDINTKLKNHFPAKKTAENALSLLLLDLSQYFSGEINMLYDLVEPPLGLMYVMTYLQQQLGDKIRGKIAKARIDFNNYQELKNLLLEFKPDVIGIRTLTFYKNFFHKTTAMIRSWGIDVPIIAGGPYATSDYQSILNDKNIDLVVLGEGEITLYELIATILKNNGQLPGDEVLKTIQGIAFIPGKAKAQKALAREIVPIDAMAHSIANESPENLRPGNPCPWQDLAYIIYTSGSTRAARGVMIRHENAVNVVSWFGRSYQLRPFAHVALLSNYTFDASVNQVFGTLVHGGTLFVVEKNLLLDIEMLRQYIDRNQIRILNFIPHLLKELLDGEPLKSVEYVISGGDRLQEPIKEMILQKGYRLYNQYGPTETTIDALVSDCSLHGLLFEKPIANTCCYILSRDNALLPPGAVGELMVAGKGAARGYMNNPELTAEKFLPLSTRFYRSYRSHRSYISKKLYKTGDLARFTPGGTIELLGRIDHQVKIRGFRIEPGEIEAHLLKHTHIKDVVVIPRKDKLSEPYLCAYFVPGKELEASLLQEYLSWKFPDYMVPKYFISMEKLPLTPGGKIDRQALPEPDAVLPGQYTPPRDEIEKKLVELWSEVLGKEKHSIGTGSNFFQLGGHSLKATLLAARIHKTFNVKVSLANLFENQTIHQLARLVKESEKHEYQTIERVEKKEYYPLSFAQKRMYIVQQLEIGEVNYNISIALSLEGEIDILHFKRVFEKLIRRHESLRTSFLVLGDTPVQKVHDQVEFKIEYDDLTGRSREECRDKVKNFLRPFDLAQPSQLRVRLIKTGERKFIFLADMHHIIGDAMSYEVLVNDFIALYNGEELPLLSIQNKDFSQWQNRLFASGELDKQGEYWLNRFRDNLPALNLPTDYARPAVRRIHQGDTLKFVLEEALTARVRELAAQSDTTLFMILLAVFNILLAKYSQQEDIVVGSPIAGRRHHDLKNLIGVYLNMLSLRNHPHGDKTFGEFLQEVKINALEAFENQDYPYEELVLNLGLQGSSDRNPLFDVEFAQHTAGEVQGRIPGLKIMPYKNEQKFAKFDLHYLARLRDNDIRMTVRYSTALYKESTILRMNEHYIEILQQAVENPGMKIKDITISTGVLPAAAKIFKEDQEDFMFS